eukprot:c53420_g1_i1.p1 GENE.c53420_g1_i1~~c53420_g1_i1.p1  ORF type:complete len:356 (+),score=67.05 c53420_g1_i1:53-1120(+)
MSKRDLYDILAVSKDATETDIKKAYKKQALKYHPDRSKEPNATEMFKQVAEAYEILSDPEKRQIYDQYGEAALKGGIPQSQDGSVPFHFRAQGFQDPFEIFQQFFGENMPEGVHVQRHSRGPRGTTVHTTSGSGWEPTGSHGFSTFNAGPRSIFDMMGDMGMGGMDDFFSSDTSVFTHRDKRRHRQQQPTDHTPDTLPPHTPVRLINLPSHSRMNNMTGRVVRFLPAQQRYTVQIDHSDEQFSIRPVNLQLLDVAVCIDGLASEPSLNGKSGTVVGFNEDSGRYCVSVDSKIVALKPQNVLIPEGCLVRVEGLASAAQHNGKIGLVAALHPTTGRYEIRFDDGSGIFVKPDNIRL